MERFEHIPSHAPVSWNSRKCASKAPLRLEKPATKRSYVEGFQSIALSTEWPWLEQEVFFSVAVVRLFSDLNLEYIVRDDKHRDRSDGMGQWRSAFVFTTLCRVVSRIFSFFLARRSAIYEKWGQSHDGDSQGGYVSVRTLSSFASLHIPSNNWLKFECNKNIFLGAESHGDRKTVREPRQ